MKVGFAGTPEFARAALEALVKDNQEVVIVMTQPDRPSGRGMKLTPSAVKKYAVEHDIPVLQPTGLKLDGKYAHEAQHAKNALMGLNLDVLIVAAYGLILPSWLLEMPTYGCLNIHASLLPRWRGAAPIQRAIEAGDDKTGITIMQMDAGLDTGDMLMIEELPIHPDDNAITLHDRLTDHGAHMIVRALRSLEQGELVAHAQPVQGVTYAEKLLKSESLLDLSKPAVELDRRIRAFTPFPGTKLTLPNLQEPVKILQGYALDAASSHNQDVEPGEVVSASPEGIDLQTGDGILRITRLQRAGGKPQDATAFLNNWKPISPGQ